MKRAVQSVLMLVALWGALLTIAIVEGWDMPGWLSPKADRPREANTDRRGDLKDDRRGDLQSPTSPTEINADNDDTRTNDVASKRDETRDEANESPPAIVHGRHRVCASEAPVLSLLSLSDRSQVIAVHCGDAIHLIAGDVAPTRIAQIHLPAPNPQEALIATRVVSADINADGLRDVVVPLLAVNNWKHPTGRGVFALVRTINGAFGSAARIVANSPIDVAVGVLDNVAGDDVLVLHATDQSVRKPREAWWISGGANIKRVATSKLAVGADQVALVDMDRDGHLDLLALSATDGQLDVVFNHGDSTLEPTLHLPVSGCDALTVVDVNGDAHDDVLCSGASNHVLLSRADRELVTTPVSLAGERVRSLHGVDINADGKLDLVGYAHPQLVSLHQGSDFNFEPRLIAELQGVGFAPISVHALDLDQDSKLDVVMIGRAPGDEASVDLVIVNDVNAHAQILVAHEASALSNAPLMLTPAL